MAGTPNWWEGFVRDVLNRWPNTELGELEGMPCLFVNGNSFVALATYDILVRVDEFTRNRALAKAMAREFSSDDGYTLPRGWILLTVPSSAAERFSEQWSRPAYEFVAAMSPKRIKKSDDDASKKKSGRKKAAKAPAKKKSGRAKAAKKPAKKKAAKKSAKKPAKKSKPAKKK